MKKLILLTCISLIACNSKQQTDNIVQKITLEEQIKENLFDSITGFTSVGFVQGYSVATFYTANEQREQVFSIDFCTTEKEADSVKKFRYNELKEKLEIINRLNKK